MPYVSKPLAKHLPTTFFDFIIIGWNFTHTWLTTYVDACNLQNWKKINAPLYFGHKKIRNSFKNTFKSYLFRWLEIIFIKKHGLKKIKIKILNKSNTTNLKSWIGEANQYSWHWSHPPLNLHIIYADVLFNFTSKHPKELQYHH